MRGKTVKFDERLILFILITIIYITNVFAFTRIVDLEKQIATQEETIVKLQDNIISLTDIVTELNVKVK